MPSYKSYKKKVPQGELLSVLDNQPLRFVVYFKSFQVTLVLTMPSMDNYILAQLFLKSYNLAVFQCYFQYPSPRMFNIEKNLLKSHEFYPLPLFSSF